MVKPTNGYPLVIFDIARNNKFNSIVYFKKNVG